MGCDELRQAATRGRRRRRATGKVRRRHRQGRGATSGDRRGRSATTSGGGPRQAVAGDEGRRWRRTAVQRRTEEKGGEPVFRLRSMVFYCVPLSSIVFYGVLLCSTCILFRPTVFYCDNNCVLLLSILFYSLLLCSTVLYCVLLCSIVFYCALFGYVVFCCALLCSIMRGLRQSLNSKSGRGGLSLPLADRNPQELRIDDLLSLYGGSSLPPAGRNLQTIEELIFFPSLYDTIVVASGGSKCSKIEYR